MPRPSVGRHRGAGDAELGERSDAEDEARTEHDVDRVGEPQHPHRDRRVAGAAEHRVDQEQQHDRGVAAEHHPRVGRCRSRGSTALRPSPRAAPVRAKQPATPMRQRHARRRARSPARRRERRRRDPSRRSAARRSPWRRMHETHRQRVEQRQHRLGEADRRDRVGAELRRRRTRRRRRTAISISVSSTIGMASSNKRARRPVLRCSRDGSLEWRRARAATRREKRLARARQRQPLTRDST